MEKFRQILTQYWGYSDFRPLQLEIIESVASGKDTLGLMPTGGGKSITFQVYSLSRKGICSTVTSARIWTSRRFYLITTPFREDDSANSLRTSTNCVLAA